MTDFLIPEFLVVMALLLNSWMVWSYARRVNMLTAKASVIPRLILAVVYMVIALGGLEVGRRGSWIRIGIMLWAILEIVHFSFFAYITGKHGRPNDGP